LESYYKGFLDLESKWCQDTGKSLYFVRGNHEQIGTFAGLYQDLLPHPAGKSYYTFRQGDTLFIALDAGNDKPDGDSGLFRNDDMIREQQEWLKELTRSAEYRNARWRIALIHMPVYKRRYDSDAAFSLLRLIPETDLILSGHLHRYFTVEPETGVCFFKRENLTMVSPDTLNALTIANDIDTLLQVDVTEDHLMVNVIEQYGNVIDTLRIDPKK
jgi:predicted phosphodiesterase